MSKALLIIICDFLLLSLLALARFDIEDAGRDQEQPEPVADYSGGKTDLVEVLTFALEQERQSRQELTAELDETVEALRAREELLRQREETIQTVQSDLRRKEQEVEKLGQERSTLEERFTAAQSSVNELQTELQQSQSVAALSQEQLARLEAQLLAQREAAARMQRELETIEDNRKAAEAEKQELATQLRVSEAEKQLTEKQLQAARGEVQTARTEVKTVRQEKAQIQQHAEKLAEGVTSLAEKSGELTQEIRENRPLAANVIFNEFIANRVHTRFQASRSGLFGRNVNRVKETKTILITDGSRIYTAYHIQDTPFEFSEAGSDWERVSGYVLRQGLVFSIPQISFVSTDPRLMVVPVGEPQADRLGSKVYKLARDPYKFPEVVLVGADEGYYGEVKFQIDAGTPGYVKMDRNFFGRFTGKFSPSSGDLVFTKTGELLGIMVNNEYCAVLESVLPARSIRLGSEVEAQKTGQVVSQMLAWKDRLPMRLQ